MNFRKKDISTNNSTTNKTTNHAFVALSIAIIAMLVGSAGVATVGAFTPTYATATIAAGGSSFVAPLQQVWAQAFASITVPKVSLTYTSSSSGTGLNNLYGTNVGFAGSDAPVSPFNHPVPASDSGVGPLLQLPESLGGVAIFYNLGSGFTTSIKLSGPVLADIYLGKITTWNNAAIQGLNPGVTLPSTTITPVFRSDGSGTSYALSNYFTKVSSDWNSTFATFLGVANCQVAFTNNNPCFTTGLSSFLSAQLGASGVGESGSGGVAGYVEGHVGTIGYADSFYAFSNGLLAASIENTAGNFVQPTQFSIASAAASYASRVLANPVFTITNAPGTNPASIAAYPGAYPIATFTYVMVWQDQDKASSITGLSNTGVGSAQYNQGLDVAQYLWWIVTQGQSYAPTLDYVALPPALVTVDEGIIQQIQYAGTPYISATTTTATSCTLTSVTAGTSTTCTATVAATAPNTGTPMGTVAWSQTGSGSVAFTPMTCTLSSGSCTVTIEGASVGSVSITAAYSGDNYDEASSGTTSVAVTAPPPGTTSTTVSCSVSSLYVDATAACTAIVAGSGSAPTGTITWSQSGTGSVSFTPSTCTLSAGSCTVTIEGVTPGSVTITASYGGDSKNAASSGTATPTVSAIPPGATATVVSCSTLLTVFSSTTCTAAVAGSSGSPTGTITWSQSGTGSVSFTPSVCTLSSGTCSVTMTTSKPGSVTITAGYSGDTHNTLSSGTTSVTITKVTTVATVVCTQSSLAASASITCTAHVVGHSPTGTVTFTHTGTGSVTFTSTCVLSSAGSCHVTTKGTLPGSVTIKASYPGDTYNLASSATTSLVVTKAPTTTTITCTKVTIATHQTMTCTATVSGIYPTHTGKITWSVHAGPGKVTFSPSTTCSLSGGKCSVTVKGSQAGSITIEATYSGDTYNQVSSGTLVRTIS
jgi:phosphate ABC transporter phosphate-binding protein